MDIAIWFCSTSVAKAAPLSENAEMLNISTLRKIFSFPRSKCPHYLLVFVAIENVHSRRCAVLQEKRHCFSCPRHRNFFRAALTESKFFQNKSIGASLCCRRSHTHLEPCEFLGM